MAPKSLVLAALLVAVASAGQVARGAGLGASANTSVIITGVVPCAVGNAISLATAQKFPNADLQLQCASTVVSSATTDSNGAFHMSLAGDVVNRDLLTNLVMNNGCKVVVLTPLGACDRSLAGAVGTLSAPLKLLGFDTGSGSSGGLGIFGGIIGLIGQIVGGLLGGILNLTTQSFSLV